MQISNFFLFASATILSIAPAVMAAEACSPSSLFFRNHTKKLNSVPSATASQRIAAGEATEQHLVRDKSMEVSVYARKKRRRIGVVLLVFRMRNV